MSDERLAGLKDDLQKAFDGVPFHYGLTLGEQRMLMREVERLHGWRDIAAEHLSNQIALEAENAVLRAENATMRPIVQAVATAESYHAEVIDVWVLLLDNPSLSYAQELLAKARALLANAG